MPLAYVMLLLLALLILGMVWVASALVDRDAASMESLYGALGLPARVPQGPRSLTHLVGSWAVLCSVSPR